MVADCHEESQTQGAEICEGKKRSQWEAAEESPQARQRPAITAVVVHRKAGPFEPFQNGCIVLDIARVRRGSSRREQYTLYPAAVADFHG